MALSGNYVAAQVLTAAELNRKVEVRVRRTANQAIATTTDTAITWPTEDADVDGFFTASGSTFIVPTGFGGEYTITARGVLASAVSARYFMAINLTSSVTGAPTAIRNSCYGEDQCSVAATIPLLAGDSFTISVYQQSGGSLNLNPAWCNVKRIGP